MKTAIAAIFTAAEISLRLGLTKRAILLALKNIPPTSQTTVNGQAASAWSIESLPVRFQEKLETEAAPAVATGWKSPLPLADIKPQFVERATKLREALALPLERQHELSSAALTELGLAEFNRVWGYSIGAKQWNRLFDRTMGRAGADSNLLRVELYLDESAFRKRETKPKALQRRYQHRELDEIIKNLENKADPTAEDRAWLFDAAFAHFEKLAEGSSDRCERAAIKASLIDYLYQALPGLSKTPQALQRVFEIKYAHWIDADRSPKVLEDARRTRSGNFNTMDITPESQKLRAESLLHDGNESLAYRKLVQAGEIRQEFLDKHPFDARKAKSEVPKCLRKAVTPEVNMCLPLRRGPWEAKMRGPYIPRDWSGVQPGDYFSGDDVTWNHYFRFLDDNGQWSVHRGECLLLTDLKTGYPLEFLLIPGHYNSEHLRALILRVHDKIGLPHKGFYFEQGVWKARLIPGQPRAKCQPLHWRETEIGLQNERILLDRRHATTPRAKPIEGLFHILQDRMRCIPGFIGFNERTDEREREQALLNRINRSGSDEIMKLPTMEEWRDQIRIVLDEFANDPQNGKMLPGVSPMEAWKAGLAQRPMRKLPDADRWRFATHKQVVRVRQEGIILTIRGQRLLYCGEATGSMIGREVIAFFNVECPELLTISDMKRQNYFTVQRIELPAMTATSEQFAAVHSCIRGHTKAAKGIYGNIQHPVIATISRDNQVDEATQELGRFHNDQVEQFQAEKSARTRKLRRIQLQGAVGGASVSQTVRNPDRVLAGIELEKACREKIAQRQGRACNPIDTTKGPSI